MKRITLTMLLVAAAGVQAMAQDPVPPTPPARPVPAPAPAPRVTPAPRPAVPVPPNIVWDSDAWRDYASDMAHYAARAVDVDAIREQSAMWADQAREAARIATENQRFNMDAMRDVMRDADREMARASAEIARASVDGFRDFAYTPIAPMPALPPMPAIAPTPSVWMGGDGLRLHAPPSPWAQGDPADSIYRIARNALTNGDYGRAAKLFSDLGKNYPKSAYATDAPYYEATARYKIGTTEELKTAAKLLEPLVAKIPAGTTGDNTPKGRGYSVVSFNGEMRRSASDNDVAALYARINGVLAQRGDRDAADKVAKAASQAGAPSCDQEDIQVKVEALNALTQMDPATAAPILKRVLDRKDECSASLRRNAVFMLGRRTDTESANMLVAVAKSDPNYGVRTSAIDALSRNANDATLAALEDLLRNDQDERIQRAVVGALMRSDNQKARNSMRALIDRKDAPVNLRIEAIQSFNSDRATADDAAYLRGLYGKAESDNLKRAIIDAVARIGGPENDQWIFNLAQNQNEPSQVRAEAIGRMMRSNVPVAQVSKLYDAADSYNMRSQIINVLRGRKEPEAADKLVDIAKNGTDYKLRSQAINALTARNDARSQQLMIDILDGKKP